MAKNTKKLVKGKTVPKAKSKISKTKNKQKQVKSKAVSKAKSKTSKKASQAKSGAKSGAKKSAVKVSKRSSAACGEPPGFASFAGLKFVKSIDDKYKVFQEIGRGAFGVVSLAHDLMTGQKVAIKKIAKANMDELDKELMVTEIKMLTLVNHPNVMKVQRCFHTKKDFYHVTELMCGGELMDRIYNPDIEITEKDAAYVLQQTLMALNYMHTPEGGRLPMAHRDLKPQNILLDYKYSPSASQEKNFHCKVIDFGLGGFVEEKQRLNLWCGTPGYMAPEVLAGCEYDVNCDIWSVGAIAYRLLTGRSPYDPDELEQKAQSGELESFTINSSSIIKGNAKAFIEACLTCDPRERPQANELLKHPFLENASDKKVINKGAVKNAFANMKAYAAQTKFSKTVFSVLLGLRTDKEELEQLEDVFNKLDVNKDGRLSRGEFMAGQTMLAMFGMKGNLGNIYDSIDIDKNGGISYGEFCAAAINKEKILTDQSLKAAFKLFDKDGDGSLTITEFKKCMPSAEVGLGKIAQKEANKKESRMWAKLLKEVDQDGDGKIDFKEFKTAMRKFIDTSFSAHK